MKKEYTAPVILCSEISANPFADLPIDTSLSFDAVPDED